MDDNPKAMALELTRRETEHGRASISWKGGALVGGALMLATGGCAFGQEGKVGQENKPVEVPMPAEPADNVDASDSPSPRTLCALVDNVEARAWGLLC